MKYDNYGSFFVEEIMKFKRIWECWLLGLVPLNSSVQGMESGIQQISMDNKKEKQMFELFPSRVAFALNNKEAAEKQDFSKIVYQMGNMSTPQPLNERVASHFQKILGKQNFFDVMSFAIMLDVLDQCPNLTVALNLSYPLEMLGLKRVGVCEYKPIGMLDEFNLDCINKVLVRNLMWDVWNIKPHAPANFEYTQLEKWVEAFFTRNLFCVNGFCEQDFVRHNLRDTVAIVSFLKSDMFNKIYTQPFSKKLYETVVRLKLGELPKPNGGQKRAPLFRLITSGSPCFFEIDFSGLMEKYLVKTPNVNQTRLRQTLMKEFRCEDFISDE